MKKYITLIATIIMGATSSNAKEYQLASPNGNNTIRINCGKGIDFMASNKGSEILTVDNISLDLSQLGILGDNPKVLKVNRVSVNENLSVIVPVKFKNIQDSYNQMELVFKGNYSIIFRAYDNGVAYRFVTDLKTDSVTVKQENFNFDITEAKNTIWPYENGFQPNPFLSHYEYLFKNIPYQKIDATPVGLPAYFTAKNGAKVVFTESDLFDYPNLFLKKDESISSAFPPVILEQEQVEDRKMKILKNADYIATTKGKRTYPWRLWMINDNDGGLLTNTLVYQLAEPSRIKDTNWIKPGKIAWDWWNANNIYGVDFKSGINNQTYKYYIDFAAKFGLEYVILDEGWTKTTLDILHSAPDINIPELVAYGNQKGVDVILWVLWNPLNEHMDEALDLYQSWGVKGIKVDFMARAEQYMVNFYTRTARACADRKLLVDFHGAYKPTGLHRTYPNVLTFESVHGLENVKWATSITPGHDANLPFTRMMAGPMDYTPGAMRNTGKDNFRIIYNRPMSQGTRAHQTALYVVFESPLQMLADNPSNYLQDQKYINYLSQFPVTWDDTKVLYADAGKAVVMARKHGNNWYIGGITDWDKFEKSFKLDFLGKGTYTAEILEDGINAYKFAEDYKLSTTKVDATKSLNVKMYSGGGYTVILKPQD